ncbi:hypothetical protein CHL78_015290 [Romboutsia weinsteinii]|uniref:Uncharacterized protein n=1 Tax=Romboutsia weinsteinii TaxID=2020949 RepID=A0A371J023_9FIRM|nr:hypothetical protein [Romboutsia weinsteinii]RDY26044.1 hypothetical protein CHL78_015290 [Romboutsia weinsteinii]
MQKFKNSKKVLDETTQLKDWVNHADNPADLVDVFEEENEKVMGTVKKDMPQPTPTFKNLRPYNKES